MTILAVLEILGGIVALIAALALFALATVTSIPDFFSQNGINNVPQWLLNTAPVFFAVVGLVVLIFAVVAFLLAWGFLKGKRWAWVLGIIFSVLNILGSVVTAIASGSLFNIATIGFSVLIPVIVLVYLLLPNTKAWFTQ